MALTEPLQVARGTHDTFPFSRDANLACLIDVGAVGVIQAHLVLFIESDPVAGSAFFTFAALKTLVIAVQDGDVSVNTCACSRHLAS